MNDTNINALREDLNKLTAKYGFKNVVNSLARNDMDRFFTAEVLEHLARRARKESLQLVGLVGNGRDNKYWISTPTFLLNEDEKKSLSQHINIFTYDKILPNFFDPATLDDNQAEKNETLDNIHLSINKKEIATNSLLQILRNVSPEYRDYEARIKKLVLCGFGLSVVALVSTFILPYDPLNPLVSSNFGYYTVFAAYMFSLAVIGVKIFKTNRPSRFKLPD